MHRLVIVAIAVTLAVAVAGTGGAKNKRKPRATGSIKGTVLFDGAPPARAKQNRSADPFCKKIKTLDESVVVGDNRGLRDVFVQIDGERAFATRAPDDPVVIGQIGCSYTPRVVGVISGQPLQIKNGDQTIHNVHAFLDGDSRFNLAQPKKARPIEKILDETGVLELTCDVHPWMRAYAVYVAHDLFSVTGATGGFEIDNVPVGKHTVSAWHPTLGRQTVDINVKNRKTTNTEIHFGK